MCVLHWRRVCTEPLLHIGHSFVTYLPLEARKFVLGLDHCVSDPDIGVGRAPPPAARRSLPCRLAPLAWPLPSPPALRFRNVVGGICRSYCCLETNPPSPPSDSDAEKCLSELASPQPPLPTPPPSPPSPATSPTPVSPPPRPHVTSTPYLVALEAVEEALMCTAVPPPSPPQPPKYVPKDPPTPPKPTVHGPYSAKTLQLIRENHGGGVQYFVDGVLNCRAMYRFVVQQPKKNPLRVWQEGMRISRSHFFRGTRSMQRWCLKSRVLPQNPPRIPKPGPQPVPRRPLPPPASDQVTLTQYSRHRRSSLLPLAPALKRPCPTPQYGSLLQRRAS